MTLSVLDWTLLFIYFSFVLGIGVALKRYTRTSNDFFQAGRALPPFNTATNHSRPRRRANAASSPISLGGNTIVSSHTLGMLLMISAAGLSSRLCG